ncbi:hypothetical protein HXA34_20595 [Salipaludibacillus agaradhaerens]|jgi:hypothetical protein|uniref:hypothetical protein n=1 Tax=Salipaludibacillus agaradhaerens TaxID=76935 RepID=UPI002150CAE4|nr:hypothetical protein [Salipaludibacillus agaradhaerens]MCR6108699.1 hypothetical protein [Salipaludibacillus agaradhaerens]MCR6120722.1 hypothetical protein [Salipaludibacillus agaradhaerens]
MNFNKMFNDDVRHKKRTASGIYSRKGSRGYVGTMHTPSDYLRGKEKKLYQNTSKVVVTNMYDKIMSFEEFEKLSESERRQTLQEYRKRHTNKKIMSNWGLTTYEFYGRLLKDLDISAKTTRPKASQKPPTKNDSELVAKSDAPIDLGEGFSIQLNGVYDAVKLQEKLEKMGLMLEDGEEYTIKLHISEK